jgi:hypothetical protein
MDIEKKDNAFKISVPLITNAEIESINNNFHSIVSEFTKQILHNKELAMAQHIIKKQETIINEMAEMINNHDIEEDVCKQMGKNRHCNDFIVSERNCINCIKEYFTNKAENVGE